MCIHKKRIDMLIINNWRGAENTSEPISFSDLPLHIGRNIARQAVLIGFTHY